MCWPLLCSCTPFCIFERCLDSNPESAAVASRRAINLATHLPKVFENEFIIFPRNEQTYSIWSGCIGQVSLSKLQMDYYPYHLARGDRRHWVRYSDAAPHRSWLHANLAAFDTRLLDILLSGSVTFNLMGRGGSNGAAWLGLPVRQARNRFSARHRGGFFPTELTSDEEMERGPGECTIVWMYVCYKI